MVSKFIKRGTNKENVWEHGNIGQFCKGTRKQGPHRRPSWLVELSLSSISTPSNLICEVLVMI